MEHVWRVYSCMSSVSSKRADVGLRVNAAAAPDQRNPGAVFISVVLRPPGLSSVESFLFLGELEMVEDLAWRSMPSDMAMSAGDSLSWLLLTLTDGVHGAIIEIEKTFHFFAVS
jgi:hypothetical protein